MLTLQEIMQYIESDELSSRKRYAKTAQNYYHARHDICDSRIFFYDSQGNLKEDKYKSNIKISHPFFTELVDQETQYILSGGASFVRSDDTQLQKRLDEYFNENEDFRAELYDIITGCIVKGSEYCYAYKGEDGRTHFQVADSLGVVQVRRNAADDQCDYLIHWYIDRVDSYNQTIKRIQVWDKEQTWYYVQVGGGDIQIDQTYQLNPRPHTLFVKNDGKTYEGNYGRIPFFRLDNNRSRTSALQPIKPLIDDYDTQNCGLSNNIADSNEVLYVVKGFQGDNLDELMTNMMAKKHIGVSDDGGVQIKTVDIPVEARRTKMEIDETNIYRFGMGLNLNGLRDTAATTNMAIKAAYSLLDLKTNRLEIRLRQFLRKLLAIVLDEINKNDNAAYQQRDVYFVFERIMPTNALEEAQIKQTNAQTRQMEINTVMMLKDMLGTDETINLVCEQLDIDAEMIKNNQKPDEYKMMMQQLYAAAERDDT